MKRFPNLSTLYPQFIEHQRNMPTIILAPKPTKFNNGTLTQYMEYLKQWAEHELTRSQRATRYKEKTSGALALTSYGLMLSLVAFPLGVATGIVAGTAYLIGEDSCDRHLIKQDNFLRRADRLREYIETIDGGDTSKVYSYYTAERIWLGDEVPEIPQVLTAKDVFDISNNATTMANGLNTLLS